MNSKNGYLFEPLWFPLNTHINVKKYEELVKFANKYFIPALDKYPELKGKVSLTIRKDGWYAYSKPTPRIIVWRETLDKRSDWRIRALVGHECAHLILDSIAPYLDGVKWCKRMEQRTTLISFARGFAYDYLQALRTECNQGKCNKKFEFLYFRCNHFFKNNCNTYSDLELETKAKKISELAQQKVLDPTCDFNQLLKNLIN